MAATIEAYKPSPAMVEGLQSQAAAKEPLAEFIEAHRVVAEPALALADVLVNLDDTFWAENPELADPETGLKVAYAFRRPHHGSERPTFVIAKAVMPNPLDPEGDLESFERVVQILPEYTFSAEDAKDTRHGPAFCDPEKDQYGTKALAAEELDVFAKTVDVIEGVARAQGLV
jgi:hypothetical protein